MEQKPHVFQLCGTIVPSKKNLSLQKSQTNYFYIVVLRHYKRFCVALLLCMYVCICKQHSKTLTLYIICRCAGSIMEGWVFVLLAGWGWSAIEWEWVRLTSTSTFDWESSLTGRLICCTVGGRREGGRREGGREEGWERERKEWGRRMGGKKRGRREGGREKEEKEKREKKEEANEGEKGWKNQPLHIPISTEY